MIRELFQRAALRPPEPDSVVLSGGRRLRLRAIRPSDAEAERAFFNGLSLDSRHQRFHVGMAAIGPGLLRQLVETDPQRHVALVAESEGRVVADARYVIEAGRPEAAEFAIAVADAWQGLGLGRALLEELQRRARAQGLSELYGDVLPDNHRMRSLLLGLGALPHPHPDGPGLLRLVFELAEQASLGWRL